MEEFWKAALRATGSVAVVGVIVWALVHFLFQEKILSLFDSEQRFIIVLTTVCGILVCLLTAILMHGAKPETQGSSGNKAVIKKSTIHGDVVLGDKHEGHKK